MAVSRAAIAEALPAGYDFESEASFAAAVGLAARERGERVVWTPDAAFVSRRSVAARRVEVLASSVGDFALLERRFGVSAFEDPYYPRGLDRRRLDFSLEC